MSAFLTKSRFKQAVECPTKLFYTGKREYLDNALEDSFLAALAQGGYQVGALACLLYPGGVTIDEPDQQRAAERTRELLARDEVILYEATVITNGLLARVDILMLADKSKRTTVDGLNQHFPVRRVGARIKVSVDPTLSADSLGEPILTAVPVRREVEEIVAGNLDAAGRPLPPGRRIRPSESDLRLARPMFQDEGLDRKLGLLGNL